MEYRALGNTDITVSAICLGTMTWGEQNTEAQAHEQMDYALERDINFFDAAELYPVPPRAETQGRTESYIGSWFAKSGHRDKIILATKVAGKADSFPDQLNYIRPAPLRFNKEHITKALEDSLTRLQTDYIDLYQLHWPERKTNFFGQLGYEHDGDEESTTSILETLQVLDECVKAGKIRYIGLSNETPWGLAQFLQLAEKHNLTRVVSVQNPYNLLNRTYEVGLAEMSIKEQAGLLAYSPLAFGVLSGKYLEGRKPEGARLTLFDRFTRYTHNKAEMATTRYVGIAKQHGLDPAQMALAYVTSRPFVTSNIIGATTMDQLKSNIDSHSLTLSEEVLTAIESVHQDIPNPCP